MNEKKEILKDQEFQHNENKKLNSQCNMEMFTSQLFDGKAFAAEQKIRDFKKILYKSKTSEKVKENRQILRNL